MPVQRSPFFSVVIDNYNYGRYLGACLDSVLAQDFPAEDVEVIVVDDGSTDGSRELLKRYAPRVRAVLQDNQGQASAFNRGIAEARGEVVCLLDSDDVWRPDKLSSVRPLFDAPEVACVEHFLEDADASLRPLPQRFPAWPARYRLADLLEGRTEWTATSAVCYRRAALLKALPIPRELFYYLDDYLTVRVLLEGEVANLPRVLGSHRVHGANWCFGGLGDARKLELDLRMRSLFWEAARGWLFERGVDARALQERWDAETARRRVLLAALSARPAEAWREWLAAPGGIKRRASLLLAVASPSLYFALHDSYATGALSRLRR